MFQEQYTKNKDCLFLSRKVSVKDGSCQTQDSPTVCQSTGGRAVGFSVVRMSFLSKHMQDEWDTALEQRSPKHSPFNWAAVSVHQQAMKVDTVVLYLASQPSLDKAFLSLPLLPLEESTHR